MRKNGILDAFGSSCLRGFVVICKVTAKGRPQLANQAIVARRGPGHLAEPEP